MHNDENIITDIGYIQIRKHEYNLITHNGEENTCRIKTVRQITQQK